jgi:hypothetical protein
MPRSVDYSSSEERMLALIPKNGTQVSTETLLKKFYGGPNPAPFNAPKAIIATISSLIRKVDANGESYEIKKSERRGPHHIFVWRETRRARRRA